MNRLGIGDILILKVWSRHHNTNEKFIISSNFVKKYRAGSDEHIIFAKYLISKLFPSSQIACIEHELAELKEMPNMLGITNYNLSSYFNLKNNILPFDKYIVISTKFRMDATDTTTKNKIKENISNFFKTFKSKYPIILEGERSITENLETKSHNVQSIYNECKYLENNNTLIDLTHESLCNTTTPEQFENSIAILNNADLCISFGIGGNFCINLCFAKKAIAFMDKNTYNAYNINMISSDNISIYYNESEFYNSLMSFSESEPKPDY